MPPHLCSHDPWWHASTTQVSRSPSLNGALDTPEDEVPEVLSRFWTN
jgi:hypothetical protein